jgi:hypothetical protein
MKTTNKILLVASIAILTFIITMLVVVRYNVNFVPATNIVDWDAEITGSMNVVTEKREIGSFNSIEASRGIHIELRQGNATGLTIEADDNLVELIVTEVVDGELRIRLKESVRQHKALHVKVDFVSLEALSGSSGARFTSPTGIVGPALLLDLSAGASVELSLDVEKLTVDASSGAHINLSGRVRELFLDSSSGALVNARELKADNATVDASSAAINHVFATYKMSIDASSSAKVNYYGKPATLSKSASSGGTIRER